MEELYYDEFILEREVERSDDDSEFGEDIFPYDITLSA